MSSGSSLRFSVDVEIAYAPFVETGSPWVAAGSGSAAPPEAAAARKPSARKAAKAAASAPEPKPAPATAAAEQANLAFFAVPPEWETGKVRFYLVYRCKPKPAIEGLWECPWGWVEANLPRATLSDCKNTYLRAFDTLVEACAEWQRRRGSTPLPRRC